MGAFLKVLNPKTILKGVNLILTIAIFFVESARDDVELRDTLKEDYGLEPIEKESDK